jgi:hypothetical protein
MLPDPRVTVVFEPQDRPQSEALLRSLGDVAAGRLLIEATAVHRNLDWLMKDVATGLGKDIELSGTGRNAQDSWEQVVAWVAAEQVRHIIVSRAHHLDRRGWALMVELSCLCGSALWFVAQTGDLGRSLRKACLDWPCRSIQFDDFARIHQAVAVSSASAPPPTDTPRFPRVPDDDFTSFRASCRAMLDADSFATIDATFIEAYSTTDRWLRERPEPRENEIADFLGRFLESSWIDEQVTCLRAAQAAFFWAGWKVQIDIERLSAMLALDTFRHLDQGSVRLLRLYLPTTYAAIGLIASLGVGPQHLADLTIADISSDGSSIRVRQHRHPIPDLARGILRAHLGLRRLRGAADEDALFVGAEKRELNLHGWHSASARMHWRAVRARLRTITAETGLAVTSHWNGSRRDDRRWIARRGISVQVL